MSLLDSVTSLHRRPVVLLYHGFCHTPLEDDTENLFVTEVAFRAQLRHLDQQGWTPLDLEGYLRARDEKTRGRYFLVTIDDGFQSVADIAAPILSEAGVPAVLFIPPAHLGGTAAWLPEPRNMPIMDAATMCSLQDHGIELGVHGFDHLAMQDLGADELQKQTVVARDTIAEASGVVPRSFAYPFGIHDANTRLGVAAAGFEVAFSVFEDLGPHAISRVDVNATDTETTFQVKLLPGYRRLWQLAGRFGGVRRGARKLASRRKTGT